MTACPLDCFDSCQVHLDTDSNDTLTLVAGKSDSYTNATLCEHLYHYDNDAHITQARYKKEDISLDTAVETLTSLLKNTNPSKVLFYKGSGNVGRLQNTPNTFFAQYGATLTHGSLCDGAGQAGIIEARGHNTLLDVSQIEKSEVVVVWGRNIPVSNAHMMNSIKGKKLIVIDPRVTKLSKMADLHIQIKPRGDFYFAVLLARFALLEGVEDKEYIEKFTDNFSWYYDFIRSIRINVAMKKADVVPSQIYDVLERIKNKKVVFLVGTGVQKYSFGHSVLHAIDSFAVLMGRMGKEGCGVNYLGDSMQGVPNPLAVKAKTESCVNVDFSKYDLIIFQGSNALEQMPQTNHVENSLEGKIVVYFGLHDNKTAKRADLIIPASNFLTKEDVRFSYTDNRALHMPKVKENETGISEYALSNRLLKAFDFAPLLGTKDLVAEFLRTSSVIEDNVYTVTTREKIPYAKGFTTSEEAFVFIEEVYDTFALEEGDYMLVSPKYSHALNSQFTQPNYVYLHPDCGFNENESVLIESKMGEIRLEVKLDSGLRSDTVCIYSGTPNLNRLTSNILSEEGENACFQEITLKVKRND